MTGTIPPLTRPSPAVEKRYALDPGWHAERERLGSLTQLYDRTTIQLTEQLGLTRGWRCADVGAGTGSIAQLLAAAVGPRGHVLAVDTDTRFLEPLADGTLSVRRQDITAQPLPAGQFDLVHARLLLEHLPLRNTVLRTLADALAPGGWLLIEDFDWVTATVVDPPAAVHERVVGACRTVLEAHGYDPGFGRHLPRALRAAGLVEVGTSATSAQVDADRVHGVPQWELLVEQLAPAMLGAALVTEVDLRDFRDLLHDGTTAVFAPLMVSSWGRRPGSGADRGPSRE
jgi:SAM-dependent methyltransferase